MAVLLCPLCSQPRFNNLESLRISLINAATQSISCPICSEIVMGLDKLTIHLFGHTLTQNSGKTQCLDLKISKQDEVQSKANESFTVPNIIPDELLFQRDTSNTQIENVVENTEVVDEVKKNVASTVNMTDLNFLTSWESTLQTDDSKDSESVSHSPKDNDDSNVIKEDDSGLSEYMSDLLNKKLPVLNFVFTMDSPETEKPPQEQPDDKQHKCSTCGFEFQNSGILSMHKELVHSNAEQSFDEADSGSKNVLKEFVLPRYDCHLCSKSFKMKGSLLVHYRVAHISVGEAESSPTGQINGEERSFRCSICHKMFKKEQHLTQHIKTHEGKRWQCETCNKHFTTKYFLKKHQRLHTGEMPYSCQTCNKTFTFQQSYHKHLLYHSDEKPHQCGQCGRSFKELSTLHNHERIHSGEKPFACETCGKCFRQRVSYIVHQRIHTGVLPYQCTACKKKFRYKVSQRSHKCTAQPPGVVIRQPGDLVQRILEQRHSAQQNTSEGVKKTNLCEDVACKLQTRPIFVDDEVVHFVREKIAMKSKNKTKMASTDS